MDKTDSDPPAGRGRLLKGASAIGALVTGVFAWLGSAATLFAHPPLEAALFLAAAAIAFGLLAIAAFRG